MSNPFDLLGNDVEDAEVIVSPPKEIVKKNTSSKKADVPPPSADPARANKNRPKPTGNEAALREKNAGRQQNRSKDVPDSSKTKKTNARKSTDRHSRTGKVDTAKRVQQGWGDDKNELDAEVQAEADAQAEAKADADAEAEAAGAKKMSLQDYLQEQASNSLNKVAEVKKVEPVADAELYVKGEKINGEPTKSKNLKTKQQKAKEFLTFDATFVDNQKPKREFGNTNNRRGGKFGGRGGKKNFTPRSSNTDANSVQKNAAIDTKNLPTLS